MNATARGKVRAEPGAKRIRAYLDGKLVADTTKPLLVWEIPYYPTYYVPAADISAELVPTGETQHSPSRGDGQVHDVKVDGRIAEDAALTFPDSPMEELQGHVRLDWESMTWFEEDEEVGVHPRDPYTRIDVLPSSRQVKVLAGNQVLAETDRAHVLFETGLPPRWYLPKVDVRMDLFEPSDTKTQCPYKGTASYYSAAVGDGTITDVAWWYPTPLEESQRIAGLVSFYPDKVSILVDGEPAA